LRERARRYADTIRSRKLTLCYVMEYTGISAERHIRIVHNFLFKIQAFNFNSYQ
jgi:hypothetical protein